MTFHPFLLFDMASCCKVRAEPGETAFHFRDFVTEVSICTGIPYLDVMPELLPNEAAEVLFAKNIMTRGRPRKVAIIGRYTENAGSYAKALQVRG